MPQSEPATKSDWKRRSRRVTLLLVLSLLLSIVTTYVVAWIACLRVNTASNIDISVFGTDTLRCFDGSRRQNWGAAKFSVRLYFVHNGGLTPQDIDELLKSFEPQSTPLPSFEPIPEPQVEPKTPQPESVPPPAIINNPDDWWMINRNSLTTNYDLSLEKFLNKILLAPLGNADCSMMYFPEFLEATTAGWPLHAVRLVRVNQQTGPVDPYISGTGRFMGINRNLSTDLPIVPLWSGFAIDCGVFAALWASLLFGTSAIRAFVRQRRLAKHGKCVHCGYSLLDLPSNVPCPECGKPTGK